MPDLTDSFCERCGARHVVSPNAPRALSFKRARVLATGLKYFVLTDGQSMRDSLTLARHEDEHQDTNGAQNRIVEFLAGDALGFLSAGLFGLFAASEHKRIVRDFRPILAVIEVEHQSMHFSRSRGAIEQVANRSRHAGRRRAQVRLERRAQTGHGHHRDKRNDNQHDHHFDEREASRGWSALPCQGSLGLLRATAGY